MVSGLKAPLHRFSNSRFSIQPEPTTARRATRPSRLHCWSHFTEFLSNTEKEKETNETQKLEKRGRKKKEIMKPTPLKVTVESISLKQMFMLTV